MFKRYGDTWFCYLREPQKLHGNYGLNGSAIPAGFEVGDTVELYLAISRYPIVRMELTGQTFAKTSVRLPDGRIIDAADVASVYRA